MNNIDLWRSRKKLNINEVCLLITGLNPSEHDLDKLDPNTSADFNTWFEIIREAIESKNLAAKIIYWEGYQGMPTEHINWSETLIKVDVLKKWLKETNKVDNFFFSKEKNSVLSCLDKSNPNYSLKLHAVIEAWLNVSNNPSTSVKTVKQALTMYLNKNAEKYGLLNRYGGLSENVIEEMASVANWETKGGAPKKRLQ